MTHLLAVLRLGLSEGLDGLAPICAQVSPRGVLGNDQTDLLNARPALQLRLACDGSGNECKLLEVDKLIDFVSRGETAREYVIFVFPGSRLQLRCDSDIEVLEAAGEDVDVGLLWIGHVARMDCCLGGDAMQAKSQCECKNKQRQIRGSFHYGALRLRSR